MILIFFQSRAGWADCRALPALSRYSHLIISISAFRETNKHLNYWNLLYILFPAFPLLSMYMEDARFKDKGKRIWNNSGERMGIVSWRSKLVVYKTRGVPFSWKMVYKRIRGWIFWRFFVFILVCINFFKCFGLYKMFLLSPSLSTVCIIDCFICPFLKQQA